VRCGDLNNGGYQAFLIPGIPTAYIAGVCPSFSEMEGFKSEVRTFVGNGGGYFGICGGAVAASSGVINPDTWLEILADRAALGLIPSKVKQDFTDPFTASWAGQPEKVGQLAYTIYNLSDGIYDETNPYGVTVTLDNIDTNHPLFNNVDLSQISPDSYDGNRLRIRWWGGPGFQGNGIAFYQNEISQRYDTCPHIWKYVGPQSTEITDSMLANYSNPTDDELLDYLGWLKNILPKNWEDFEPTCHIAETYLKDTAAIASATYGNNNGKVLAFAPHPEDSIWQGGTLVEAENTLHNSLGNGLYHWDGFTDLNVGADHWLIVRGVAWVAGVEPADLPYTQ